MPNVTELFFLRYRSEWFNNLHQQDIAGRSLWASPGRRSTFDSRWMVWCFAHFRSERGSCAEEFIAHYFLDKF
jgi:hypothetical protein